MPAVVSLSPRPPADGAKGLSDLSWRCEAHEAANSVPESFIHPMPCRAPTLL